MTRRARLQAMLLAMFVLAITWVAALPDDISAVEEFLFRAVNDLPDLIEYPGWPVMQFGAIIAVPVMAAVYFALFRDWRVPAHLVLAGGTAWLVAKVAKELVGRGRPAAFLSDINLRPAWDGLGFPSGHTAVAFAIAVVLGAALSRRWRNAIWGIAIVAGLLRIYTAAHLPLDVVGGWALGIAVGSIVELSAGRPSYRRSSLGSSMSRSEPTHTHPTST